MEVTTDTNIQEMTLEDIVRERQKYVEYADLADAGKKIMDEEIKERMKTKSLSGAVVDGLAVTIVRKVTYAPSLEWATEIGAIQTVVDAKKVKQLASKGVVIPGEKKMTEYVMVRPIEGVE